MRYARDEYKAPLPKYVENEFRNYLACGDFSRGFVVVRCESCDHHLAVAFALLRGDRDRAREHLDAAGAK